MIDFPTKVDFVSTLSAAEFNSLADELEHVIEDTNITLSGGDDHQIGKSVSNYVAAGDFYTDVGTPDTYVLNVIGSKQRPTEYFTGFRARYIAGTSVTGGAVTVNVGGLGVKSIKDADGSDPEADEIEVGHFVEIFYNGSNFVISNSRSFVLPFLDSFAIIANVIDPTKRIGFDASNVATATRRNIIMPDRDVNLNFSILQEVSVFDATYSSTGTNIPQDNTIPQKTEGAEFMTLAITPLLSTSKLKIEVVCVVSTQAATPVNACVSLFRDAAADAVKVSASGGSQNVIQTNTFTYIVDSVAASLTTFKVRAGASSGTLDFNGAAGGALYGGTFASSIRITEYIQ